MHGTFEPFEQPRFNNSFGHEPVTPDQLRWDPLPLPDAPTDFVDGLYTMAGNGYPVAHSGVAIHLYAANASMDGRWFYDAAGELMVVTPRGRMVLAPGLGVLEVERQEKAFHTRDVRSRAALSSRPEER